MTVAEMIAEVRRGLGNRTDLTDARLLLWLNWAEQEICGFHRKKILPPRRFHILEGAIFFSFTPYDGTTGASTDVGSVELPATFTDGTTRSTTDDFYVDWIAEIGTEKRLITDYAQSTGIATVAEDWSSSPASTSINLYQRYFPIGAGQIVNAGDIWSIERMEDAADGTALTQVNWEDVTGIDPTSTGTPTKFSRRGDFIIFDTAPDTAGKMKLYYYKHQTSMVNTLGTETPTLPGQWHSVIVAGAIYRGFRALMEPLRAAQARNEFLELAQNARDEREWDSAHISRRMKVRL